MMDPMGRTMAAVPDPNTSINYKYILHIFVHKLKL